MAEVESKQRLEKQKQVLEPEREEMRRATAQNHPKSNKDSGVEKAVLAGWLFQELRLRQN